VSQRWPRRPCDRPARCTGPEGKNRNKRRQALAVSTKKPGNAGLFRVPKRLLRACGQAEIASFSWW
jgi:hypothetical protein